MNRKNIKKERQGIAKQRLEKLFDLASEADKSSSKRYITLARKISTKYNLSIPRPYKRLFCKACNNYMKPSLTCSVRLSGHNIVQKCLICRHISRYRYKK